MIARLRSGSVRAVAVRTGPLLMAWLGGMLVAGLAGCSSDAGRDPAAMRAYEMSLAVGADEQYAAWHGGLDEQSSIYIQKLGSDGQLTGAAFQVSEDKALAYEPDLLLANDQLVVAWYEKGAATGLLTAMMAGVERSGHLLWRVPLTDAAAITKNPVVRQIGQHLHVAWIQQDAAGQEGAATIWHRRFSLGGVAETPPRQIGLANKSTWNLNATVYGASLIVTYDAALGHGLNKAAHELHMLIVTDEAVQHRPLSPDDGYASLYPDLQINDAGQAALSWFDEKDGNREVYLTVAPLDALGTEQTRPPMRITHDKGESTGAYVAWNGPTLRLAWSDEVGGSREVFVKRFGSDGRSRGPAQQISRSVGRASIPTIRASGSGFLVAWNDYQARVGGDAHMQITSSVVRVKQVPAAP